MSSGACSELIADREYIETWSVDECAVFIEDAGFPQYKHTFVFNTVVGADLLLMQQQHLCNLGIRNFKEQKQIMGFLKQLKLQEDEQKLADLQAEEDAQRQAEEEARRKEEAERAWREEPDAASEDPVHDRQDMESTDTVANFSTIKFDALEQKVRLLQKSPEQLRDLWDSMDANANGLVSLAEIDRMVIMKFPILNNKYALMRAYKYTTQVEGDGDSWVERKEFASLLKNLFFFNKLWSVFALLDSGRDRRLNIVEFSQGLGILGLQLNKADTERVFGSIDTNGGGEILFDEFCEWVISNHWDVD